MELTILEGQPYPVGVTYSPDDDAYNFALLAEGATGITLEFYHRQDVKTPRWRVELSPYLHRTQATWHCQLLASELVGIAYYAYRVEGSNADTYRPEKVLLDPYAKEIFFPKAFDRQAAIDPGDNAGKAPLGLLYPREGGFHWQNDRPVRHQHDLVVYELHVGGFTKSETSGVAPDQRGTFSGVVAKIPYLRELGVTAVELMPVHQYDPQEGSYWGYMTLNFFSPHHEYTSSDQSRGQLNEFKYMVRELHRAGIEVILDVVFNHTTEGDSRGPTYSFKGIDTTMYYIYNADADQPFYNYTGTGNTINAANRHVRRLILDSLRYWVQEMHVDGFRFDLGSIFSRRADGSLNTLDPSIFAEIENDSVLAGVRLIAEPWDASGLYQLGHDFPGQRWRQWNDRFRDTLRRFVRGDEGMVGEMITRLYGSDDFFDDDLGYRPYQSVNFVTAHDGFTLYDLTAYTEKRNEANGHDNTDGHNDNHSANYGHEGDEGVPDEVMALRRQQAKSFCALLLLANGTPMFVMGDEFLRTQRGNNNAYNQDNDLFWVDWRRQEQFPDVWRFFQRMIAFRKQHPSVGRTSFWREDVRWFGTDGPITYDNHTRTLAFCLSGASLNDDDLYVMINMSEDTVPFTFQTSHRWRRVADTSLPAPEDFPPSPADHDGDTYQAAPRSVVVWIGDAAQPETADSELEEE